MPEPYKIVVGLEVHVQLLTQSKLFCGCSTKFGAPPNTQVCQVCLGMPGVLPVLNRKAFDLSLRAALALNCQIAGFTKWDRKNYYYPDLPKNYQISQYDLPFSHDGFLEIETAQGPKKIGIIRAHLEEDAGKSMHDESGRGGDSKVDLNRTGTPLLEIVSQPDINSPEEAEAYLRELRLMLREIGVSDCEMQEGSLRCDANVNIHVPYEGGTAATPLVEVKNLNSIGSVARSIAYEAERQFGEFKKDPKNYRFGKILKTTAGWNDARGVTQVQRHKEEAADYRYFPEPDLVPVIVSTEQIEQARIAMGELPAQQRTRLQQAPYALSAYDANVLTSQGRKVVAYFEAVAKVSDPKAACNWVANELLASLKERGEEIDQFPIQADRFSTLVNEIKTSGLKREKARDVYAHMLEHGSDAKAAMTALGYVVEADESKLLELIRKGIAANEKAVADFKKGNEKALDRVFGAVMRETKGMGKPDVIKRLLLEEVAKMG
jgi:aspartyl-tRNA(Asn)/glutamyl-tRNA(Gln) amidotransferase subunit B